LTQTGLSTTTTTNQAQARDFTNIVLAETMPLVPWWWLDQTTTFATVASTRTYQPVSGQVTAWYSFMDETNNRELDIVGPDQYDLTDADRSETGTVELVYITGLDSTTGYPVVELWRLPTAVATVRVRYRREVAEFAASDDATDLTVLGMPRIIQNVLVHGATELYMAAVGNSDADRYRNYKNTALQQALTQNRQMQGSRRYLPIRRHTDAPLIRVDATAAVEA